MPTIRPHLKVGLERAKTVLRASHHPANMLASLIALSARPEHVHYQPELIKLETTTRCNLACGFCGRTWAALQAHGKDRLPDQASEALELRRLTGRAGQDMDLATFLYVLDQFPCISRLDLQGMGEPLMNPEFRSFIDLATERGIWVQFYTNGTLLEPGLSAYLVRKRVAEITVSLDGSRPETYQRIRSGAVFEKTLNNVAALAKARQNARLGKIESSGRLPRLRLATVLTRHNVSELPDLVRLCKEIGFDQVVATQFKPISPELQSWVAEPHEVHERVRLAKQTARRLKQDLVIEFALPEICSTPGSVIAGRDKAVKLRPCNWPWTSLNITINGTVSPCAYMPEAEIWGLGNLFETSFKNLWNSPAYKNLRRCHKTGNLVGTLCADCQDI